MHAVNSEYTVDVYAYEAMWYSDGTDRQNLDSKLHAAGYEIIACLMKSKIHE